MNYKILHLDNCEMTQVGLEQIATNYCCVDFIVGMDKNFKQCTQLLETYKPDIAIINLDSVNNDMVDKIVDFSNVHSKEIKIVLVASSLEEESFNMYYAKGVRGFLFLNSHQQSIVDCILSMYKNDPYISKEFQKDFKKSLIFDKNTIIKAFQSLTFKEIKVSELIIMGKTTNEIADTLCNSKRTIDAHRRNIIEKLSLIGSRNNLSLFLAENKAIFFELFPEASMREKKVIA
ncbi:LuxR C-terminal-related transcriptional regulator [Aquimarina agarivorans]|uniref:LuxR C-terminal-related transcriptional regulator n=1 Tax=Aquimarina agarivorans TaxID=980584 RepID=UPI000248ED56|nr:LuxR C-terminal-related transcriptional regulator [Aquimarina agarivorans]